MFVLRSVPKCTPEDSKALSGGLKRVDSVCSMSALDDCGEGMACQQQQQGGDVGLCECLPGYERRQDGVRKKIEFNNSSSIFNNLRLC